MLPAIIGAGASILGGLFGRSSAKDSAESANAFTKEQLQNRHQWEVNDLKKAGLNPVLSAGGTPSIGGSAQAATPDFASNANSAIQAGANRKLQRESLDIQRAEAQSRVNLNSASAEKQMADAELARDQLSNNYWGAQAQRAIASADQARATIGFLQKQGVEIDARVKNTLKQLEVAESQVKHYEALVTQANSTASRNHAEAALARARENSQGYQDTLSEALAREANTRASVSESGAAGRLFGPSFISNFNEGVNSAGWLRHGWENFTKRSPLRIQIPGR